MSDQRELIEQAAREMRGEPVPVTVVAAEWVKDDDAALAEWRLTAVTSPVIDGALSIAVPVRPEDPQELGRMFRVLHVLGVLVPLPFGTKPESESFWEQGWDEHRVAEQMTGAKVMAARSSTGKWFITGTLDLAEPEPLSSG